MYGLLTSAPLNPTTISKMIIIDIKTTALRVALIYVLIATSILSSTPAYSETCLIAVSANFSATIKKLKQQFEAHTPHKLKVSTGSTGQLFSHVINGAPFDIFLSADSLRPSKLSALGYSAESKGVAPLINYAQGRLILWLPTPNSSVDEHTLRSPELKKISLANPKTAPYGKAAQEVLGTLSIPMKGPSAPKRIYGDSVTQSLLFVLSGNTQAGFIGLSQIRALPIADRGSMWLVPQSLYQPIIQQAILLKHGETNPAALAFMTFLSSQQAKDSITQMGYSLPKPI